MEGARNATDKLLHLSKKKKKKKLPSLLCKDNERKRGTIIR